MLAANPWDMGFNTISINKALWWKIGRWTAGQLMRDDGAAEFQCANEFNLGRDATKSAQVTETNCGGVESLQ